MVGLSRRALLLAAVPTVFAALPFSSSSRGTNTDGSTPIYKNADAAIEDRVEDLLARMTVQEKVSQMYVTSLRLADLC